MNPDPDTLGRYVKPRGPKTARIMVIAEAPGFNEEKWGLPMQGQSGLMLTKEMLPEAGIDPRECYYTKVCRYRPPDNDIRQWIAFKPSEVTPDHKKVQGLYVKWPIAQGLEELRAEIELVKPTCILALGNTALWACTGHWGIQDWRGSLEQCILVDWPCKVIPSFHPAAIIRQMEWRSLAMIDLRRVAKESQSREFPTIIENFLIEPDYQQAKFALLDLIMKCDDSPTPIAYDIETRAGHIACIGFAWSAVDAVCIPLMAFDRMEGYWSEEEEGVLVHLIYLLMTHKSFIGIAQHGIYDNQYILRHWCFMPNQVRDTEITHHAIMPTGNTGEEGEKKKNTSLKKSLGVLSSIYRRDHRYWKNQLEESMEDE